MTWRLIGSAPKLECYRPLQAAAVDELVKDGKGKRFDPGHGRLMKEWVVVEAGRANWVELAREACNFVKRGKR